MPQGHSAISELHLAIDRSKTPPGCDNQPQGPFVIDRKRHSQRSGMAIWLAFFAMLMIHLGPLVSQSMPMDHVMPAMAGMDEMACSDQARSGHHESVMPKPAAGFMEKCGYCGLLIHSPVLDAPQLFLPADLPGAAPAPQVVIEHPIPASPVFPGARSRAPPSMTA